MVWQQRKYMILARQLPQVLDLNFASNAIFIPAVASSDLHLFFQPKMICTSLKIHDTLQAL